MLVVPLVSKSSVLVIRLSQQGEVCTSGISLPFSQSNSTRIKLSRKQSLKEGTGYLFHQEHYSVLSGPSSSL